jgi:mannitol/fructose-specific phosphotransferase system IIA component (Ntr-type)
MNMKTIEADLVVTTIYLESRGIPVVSVEPLLSEENIKDLGKVLAKRTVPREDAVDRILAEVEKFSTIHQPKLMRQAIRAIVEGKRSGKKLSELLNTSHILLGQRVDSWQEAVGLAAQPLLTDGAITEGYYLRMLENIERFRAYVVIKKFVAMPHARPEDGALDLQASLVVLDKGVKFGHPKNDPVRIVFILTAIDPQQHLQALDTFRKMIATDEALKRLKQMQSKEACRQWIMELEE